MGCNQMDSDINMIDLPERVCRNCKSFIRVRDSPERYHEDTPYDRSVMRVGFCLLGQCKGIDFGLYYNTRKPDCNSYCYDAYNDETYKMELTLKNWVDKITKDTFDRRTKAYKILDGFRNSLDDPALKPKKITSIFGRPIRDESLSQALSRLGEDRLMEYLARLYISSVARDQIFEIHTRKCMPYKEYDRVLGYIRFKLADAYESGLKHLDNEIKTEVGE